MKTSEETDLFFDKLGVVTDYHYSLIESNAITRMISDNNMSKEEMETNFKRIALHNQLGIDNDTAYEEWLERIGI